MTKTQINKIINNYCEQHSLSKRKYSLFPLYAHFDGFSHSIGFIDHKAKPHIREHSYTSVGYSAYTHNAWGYDNEHQRNIAILILSQVPHYTHQNNAKEILF